MRHRFAVGLAMALTVAGPVAPALAEDPRTRIVLNEIATRAIEQDTLVAELCVRAASGSGQEAQQLLDTAMAGAFEMVTASSGIAHLARGGYRVFQARKQDERAGAWIAERDLKIKSKEIVLLLQLIGRLQAEGLVLKKLAYELSTEGRRAAENELAADSIAALRARGQKIAEGVGMRVDAIETLRVAGTGSRDRLPTRAENGTAAPEPEPELLPMALPGQEPVSVTVDVEVSLTGL